MHTTRYFFHKLSVAVGGDPSVVSFMYLADGTDRDFEQFLVDHTRLVRWLPAWTIVAIGPSAVALARCERVFERMRQQVALPESIGLEDLCWLCTTRQPVDRGDLTGLGVADIDRYRTLRDQLGGTTFDALYAGWCRHGEAALASYVSNHRRPPLSHGQIVLERLPFDYRPFGLLSGVA